MGLYFGILFLIAIIHLFLMKHFFSLLKKRHPKKYKELGEPTVYFNSSMKNQILVFMFFVKRDYIKLNDSKIKNLCIFLTIYYLIFIILFLTFFITFVSTIPESGQLN